MSDLTLTLPREEMRKTVMSAYYQLERLCGDDESAPTRAEKALRDKLWKFIYANKLHLGE